MLTTRQRKELIALQNKKERQKRGLFLVEGVKLVEELLRSKWEVTHIFAVETWNPGQTPRVPVVRIQDSELEQVSAMEAPNQVLAVVRIPEYIPAPKPEGLVLALAGLRDPGNMGTVLRIADWFGVSRVICSLDCAECFNPKVVQASMGSIFRVPLHRQDLDGYLGNCAAHVEIAAACAAGGENLFGVTPREPAVVILGSEGQGIPDALMSHVHCRITIPRTGHAESLNVATAAAVVCAEWKREVLSRSCCSGQLEP